MTNRGPSIVLGSVQWGLKRYPALWIWEPYEEPKETENGKKYGEYYSFPLHRLYAYAHGIIDHPRFDRDSREIHHVDEDKWNSMPDNLEAHTPEMHGRITNGTN